MLSAKLARYEAGDATIGKQRNEATEDLCADHEGREAPTKINQTKPTDAKRKSVERRAAAQNTADKMRFYETKPIFGQNEVPDELMNDFDARSCSGK